MICYIFYQNSEIENDIANSGITVNHEDSMEIMINQLIHEYNDYKDKADSLSQENDRLVQENAQLKNEKDTISNLYKDSVNKTQQLKQQLADSGQEPADDDSDNDSIASETFSDSLFHMDTMSVYTPKGNFYKLEPYLVDSIGNRHNNVILCGARNQSSDLDVNTLYAEYYINGQYSLLKGNAVIPQESKNYNDVHVIYFYGDDELITQTDPMTIGSLPYEFAVPLTGVTKLRIESVRTEKNSGNSSIALTEACFYQ